MRRTIERLKDWARIVRRDAVALCLATRDPRVPWYAKALAALIAAYALSPIDLIPDFIPVIGYLDELIILPFAIAGVVRLINPAVMAEHRAAATQMAERPTSKLGAALVAGIWLSAIAFVAWWLLASLRAQHCASIAPFGGHHGHEPQRLPHPVRAGSRRVDVPDIPP